MNSRSRILITLAFVCHLLLAPQLVTSQLPPTGNAQSAPFSGSQPSPDEEDVTIKALSQEKDGPIFKLHGQAEIRYTNYILYADEVIYNSDTGEATADGHVVLDGSLNDEHIQATHAQYNIRQETGKFQDVVATIGAKNRAGRLMLSSPNPFLITARTVEKTSPDHYVVSDGSITTCELPHPKWRFKAKEIVVDVGSNAKIYHTVFGIRGVPVVYFPFATLPTQREPRQSGFMIPNIGTSSVKGTIVGESFFWAINRSMDAHIGADYYSARGWAPKSEFRARPSETSFIDLNFFSVLDRGFGKPPVDQGGEEARINAEGAFGHNFRGVANLDYLSSFVFRLAFSEVFTQAVNSEVKSVAFLSNTTNNYFTNAAAQRYQNFESTTHDDVITILHAPGFESSTVERQIAHSPFYWSYDGAVEGLSRSEPGFSTAPLLARLDFAPELSLPLHLDGWSMRPALGLRDTFYSQRLIPSPDSFGAAVSNDINRKALEGSVDLRVPTLEKLFDKEWLGRKWKHVVEPEVTYRYVTGINNFPNILRFDERDIMTDTNEVEYRVVNRLYAKRTSSKRENCGQEGMPSLFVGGAAPPTHIPWEHPAQPADLPCNSGPAAREILTWELAQKYYIDPTFGGAFQPGQSNTFTSTVDLTGISFLTQERHLSPLISRVRLQTTPRTDIEWDLDYDFKLGRMNTSNAFLNYRVGPFTIGGGDAYLHIPAQTTGTLLSAQKFNQFRLLLGYGHPDKQGFSAATNVGFDANLNFLQYAAVQTTYNWDCCGINLEFRRFALGSVRNENQYRFTFALANLGALGNLRRQERLF